MRPRAAARDSSVSWIHFGDATLALRRDGATRENYRKALRSIDDAIGVIGATLDTSGLAGTFHLVVVSLHGEGLGEGGEALHGLTLSDATMRVPVVASPPSALGAREPRTLSDLAPALLEGLELSEEGAKASESTVIRATRTPHRAYGWRDEAEVLGSGGWSTLPS
ncbi:MAG: sulfatase-like hydrolase/transferase, partial [Acidobacteria bacterium]|nr:sulfatase-like hydrolase/transferase [Acidobacteriota bacterium]